MGAYLIFAISWTALPWVIVQVALGLSLIIFVHELGHFVVAKLCGVKCEKFYVGFDIAGKALFRLRHGETEYGIGILPLGGYVKMLGQDDNPARAAEEIRRSHIEPGAQTEEPSDTKALAAPTQNGSDESSPAHDPRSYLAQSVPKRMAIISAGVVMNVVFAVVVSSIAYGMGVRYLPCVVSEVTPGGPAWQAGIHIGDRIVGIDEVEGPPQFNDLMSSVALVDFPQGVRFTIRRPTRSDPFDLVIRPDPANGDQYTPKVGIFPPFSTTLNKFQPVIPDSVAARAEPAFEGGDEIVDIDGEPVRNYADLHRLLALKTDEQITVTVLRKESSSDEETRIPIEVARNRIRHLGLVMEVGRVTAVQDASPAATAGIQPGDFIDSIDGSPIDPMRLPDELRKRAGATISVKVEGDTDGEPNTVVLRRVVDWYERSMLAGNPVSVPAMGLAYDVLCTIHAVEEGSPAAAAGLEARDVVVKAELIDAEDAEIKEREPLEFSFSADATNWPAFFDRLQSAQSRTRVKLTYKRGDDIHEAVLQPENDDWFFADRGFLVNVLLRTRKAESFSQAAGLGIRQTKKDLFFVAGVLKKLGHQISLKSLGGPGTIAAAAGSVAEAGFAEFLLFLGLFSANLAVINFLPIPVLDGGHFVFLAYEGIFRRPPSERVFIALTYLGFLLIVTLMLFVIFLDVQRLVNWLASRFG